MKKRICALLLSLCMLLTFLPAAALAADGIATVNGETVTDLQGLLEKVTAATGTIEIQMLEDLELPTDTVLIIEAGKTVELDMAGHSITVPEDYASRPIKNEGTLTVTGNGTIDTSMSEKGLGAINNLGVLTIENGTYRGATYADGAVIRNTGADSVLTINGGTFEKATRAVYNEGTATINDGTFTGTTCSRCNPEVWAYTIINYGSQSKMTINGGTFTGVQGAVSASVGELIINDGSFKTVACKDHHDTDATFYALYAAGEVGEVTCTVNGGTFETEGKYCAALVGNDNTGGDGGINAKATAYIKGGTFIAPEGVPALKSAAKTGDPEITGGTFTYADNLAQYVPETHYIAEDGERFTVTKLGADNADARIGNQYYKTLPAAVAAAGDGDTVTLPGHRHRQDLYH